jgi:hypothetical protein
MRLHPSLTLGSGRVPGRLLAGLPLVPSLENVVFAIRVCQAHAANGCAHTSHQRYGSVCSLLPGMIEELAWCVQLCV